MRQSRGEHRLSTIAITDGLKVMELFVQEKRRHFRLIIKDRETVTLCTDSGTQSAAERKTWICVQAIFRSVYCNFCSLQFVETPFMLKRSVLIHIEA